MIEKIIDFSVKKDDNPPLLLGEGAGGEVLISFVRINLNGTILKFEM